LLDKVRLEHAAPAPVISPLKTRPLTTPQSTSSRDVGSATSSWGGSRIGSGSLSKKDKQKLKRRMYNTKLAFRRKLCGIRIKRKQLKRIKQEHLRVKISSYVEKLQESNLDCDFSPVSEENTSAVSTYQSTKLSNQSTTLIAFYRLNLVNLTQNRVALYDQVSASMMFHICSSSIQIWVLSFEQNQG